MTDRDILVALIIGGAAVIMGAVDAVAKLSAEMEGSITFVSVALAGWAGYRINR